MRRWSLWLAILALTASLPWWASEYTLIVASRIAIYAILAVSLDLILGYCGLVSFGHAAFFGIGAYATGGLIALGAANGYLHLVAAASASALFAFVVGVLSIRARGIYFIMLTFAFAQMIFYLAVSMRFFGGDDGMRLARQSDFGEALPLSNPAVFYYFCLAFLGSILFACERIVHSRFGFMISAARQNDVRLQTLGARSQWYQIVAFVIAAAFAGIAGSLMANLNAYISPNLLDWKVSATVILMIVLGGIGTLYGGVLGAVVYIVLEIVLSAYTDHWMVVFGPLLVVASLWWRRGLFAPLAALSRDRR
ncbi:MAG: branched-chain amino acid ABC transporter permease [Lautropia sp.]